jgi:hypothetical protein
MPALYMPRFLGRWYNTDYQAIKKVDTACHAMTCGGVICDSYYDPAKNVD